jgi:hypothetical protein
MVSQLRLSRRASVKISQVHIYETIYDDWSTCSQQQNLHSCGGCRIRTSRFMSPPSQYKTYQDLSDIKLIEFSQ